VLFAAANESESVSSPPSASVSIATSQSTSPVVPSEAHAISTVIPPPS
jgi:hypothetical protein